MAGVLSCQMEADRGDILSVLGRPRSLSE
jgi:hypothetical protein